MTGGESRTASGTAFGPQISHTEAIRRLTALSSTCKRCAPDAGEAPAMPSPHADEWSGGAMRSTSVPTLRHYPTRPPLSSLVLPTMDSKSGSLSPPSSPPPSSSFWGALFDKSPSSSPTSSSFLNTQKLAVPPLWNDMHDHSDMTR